MARLYTFKNCQYLALLMVFVVFLNQVSLMRYGAIIQDPDIPPNSINYKQQKHLQKPPKPNTPIPQTHFTQLYNINLTTKMINAETNEVITCDPHKYNYIKLLLSDLQHFNRRDTDTLVTTSNIDKFFEYKDKIRWYWLRRARIQIINGKIYTNNPEIGNKDEEGYRTGVVLYLKHIYKAYRNYIPDTDFLWHYHDKKGSMNNLAEYDWSNTSRVPIFVSDFNEASLSDTRTLFMIPRGWLKYKFFADIAENEGGENESELYSDKNIRRIKDYLEFLEISSNNPELLEWEHKSINKAVFRGYLNNGFSRKHFFDVLNLSDFRSVAQEYFDAKFTTEWANTAELHKREVYKDRDRFQKNKKREFSLLQSNVMSVRGQFEYRYQVNVDGFGVRDNLMYQMLSGSIILKQLSTLIEFWYYDLVHDRDVIFWENILDLVNIVIKLVDSVDLKHRWHSGKLTGYHNWILRNWQFMVRNDMTRYNNEKLKEISENAKEFVKDYLSVNNMDCYFVHILEIYNHYFYDVNTLPKEPHRRLTQIT